MRDRIRSYRTSGCGISPGLSAAGRGVPRRPGGLLHNLILFESMRASILIWILAGTAYAQTPVRSCESLVSVALPNTTIESAAVEAAANGRPAFCRVMAVVTHPPAGDRVR